MNPTAISWSSMTAATGRSSDSPRISSCSASTAAREAGRLACTSLKTSFPSRTYCADHHGGFLIVEDWSARAAWPVRKCRQRLARVVRRADLLYDGRCRSRRCASRLAQLALGLADGSGGGLRQTFLEAAGDIQHRGPCGRPVQGRADQFVVHPAAQRGSLPAAARRVAEHAVCR